MGPKIWNIVPRKIRDLPTMTSFKYSICKVDLTTLLDDNKCRTVFCAAPNMCTVDILISHSIVI